MLKSMTGFGTSSTETDKVKINVEIKSLNNKFLELFVKLPKQYSDKEFLIRNESAKLIERGKVNVIISMDYMNPEEKPKVHINQNLLAFYYEQLAEGAKTVGATTNSLFSLALNMPEVVKPVEKAEDEQEWELVYQTYLQAVESFTSFRYQEGALLQKDLEERTASILNKMSEIEQFEPSRIAVVRERIEKHLQDALNNEEIDRNRLEQELVYYIEKFDITEEKVRLRGHCSFFLETLRGADSNGKKLSFISQEMGREINTMGSKANNLNIQRIVVEMKDELEKIKEQLLNIQ